MRALLTARSGLCAHHTHAPSSTLHRNCFVPSLHPPRRASPLLAQGGQGGYDTPFADLQLTDTPIPEFRNQQQQRQGYPLPQQQQGGLFANQQQNMRTSPGQQWPQAQQQQQQQQQQPQQQEYVPVNNPYQGGGGQAGGAPLYPLYDNNRGAQPGWGAQRPPAPAGPYRGPAPGPRPPGYPPRGPNVPRVPGQMTPSRRMERLERGRERSNGSSVDDRPRIVAGKKVLVNESVLRLGRSVKLLGSEGEFLGVVPADEALSQAQEEEVDLVCLSPEADPVLCKLVSFSKYKYELEKKDKESKKKQKESTVDLKEVRLRPSIDVGDLNVKLSSAKKFLEKANKVKIVMSMSGRELRNRQKGQEVLQKFVADLAPVGMVEGTVSLRGNTFTAVVAPKK